MKIAMGLLITVRVSLESVIFIAIGTVILVAKLKTANQQMANVIATQDNMRI